MVTSCPSCSGKMMLLVYTIFNDNFELLEHHQSVLQVLWMVGWYAMVYLVAVPPVSGVKHLGVC